MADQLVLRRIHNRRLTLVLHRRQVLPIGMATAVTVSDRPRFPCCLKLRAIDHAGRLADIAILGQLPSIGQIVAGGTQLPDIDGVRPAWLGGSGVWRRSGKKPCQAQRFLIRLLTEGKRPQGRVEPAPTEDSGRADRNAFFTGRTPTKTTKSFGLFEFTTTRQ